MFFPIPVDDFAFSLHALSAAPQQLAQQSAAIVFCVDGEAVLERQDRQLRLQPGESCFIPACESPVSVSGSGRIARVYNLLP
ncbi:Mannose-6-phosphate isomerase [Serratia rubidaea]|uniref:Phosphohexomutase n=1 Tax=Serratia rubidaea TaxID=61652 RepID=A0A3S4JWD4_SERRU|nr:Mannose-6-phosphate isomerase [Serratia rubidaea]